MNIPPLYEFRSFAEANKDLTNYNNQYIYCSTLDKNKNPDIPPDPECIRLLAMISAIAMAISYANFLLPLASSSGGNNKKNKARQTKRPRQTKRGKSRRRR